MFPEYFGPFFLVRGPKVAPSAPIDRVLDFRCRCARTMIPLAPERGVTMRKSLGATSGAGCDVERVVARPAALSFEKSPPGVVYAAFSRAKSAGRGVFDVADYAQSALISIHFASDGEYFSE